jgi:radical SAM protein with 4Fe4S-binding SPASM domain
MWTGCVITFNGDVVPCCFDKNAEYNMGNIKDTSIEKLWKSKKYQAFRRQLIKDRSSIEMCRNCTEGLRNS